MELPRGLPVIQPIGSLSAVRRR